MKDAVFSEYARYYDLLYKDKDYSGEANYIEGLIKRFHPKTKTILELGSGTGKHALLLAKMGYKVTGIERSEEMLAQAREFVESEKVQLESSGCSVPEFVQGDIRTVRIEQQHDTAISLFHVISYQTTNDDLLATFHTASQHLKPGGLFVFDVWYGPAVLTERPQVRVKRMIDDKIEVTRLAEPVLHPSRNTVDVNYQVFIRNKKNGKVSETREKHEMRYLFAPELHMLLNNSGCGLLHHEEWMTGRPSDVDTWGVCFVARKKS